MFFKNIMYAFCFFIILFVSNNALSVEDEDVDIKETPSDIRLKYNQRRYTEAEVKILQELEKRRIVLDRREKALELRERLVDLAEKRLAEKTDAMEILKSQLEGLLNNLSDKEESELHELAKIYEVMKAESAANVLNRMDNKIVFDIFKRMTRKSIAKIMEKMDTGKARLISEMLAEKSDLPLFKK